jgi:hypothetical protein
MSELRIDAVRPVTGHILNIRFNDGHECLVDFSRFIFGVGHPDYEKYKSTTEFLKYDIVDGNLNWDDYTMIFPVEDLYFNRINP